MLSVQLISQRQASLFPVKLTSRFPGSSRIKRSPKPRRKHQVNGCPGDAEKDRLIDLSRRPVIYQSVFNNQALSKRFSHRAATGRGFQEAGIFPVKIFLVVVTWQCCCCAHYGLVNQKPFMTPFSFAFLYWAGWRTDVITLPDSTAARGGMSHSLDQQVSLEALGWTFRIK